MCSWAILFVVLTVGIDGDELSCCCWLAAEWIVEKRRGRWFSAVGCAALMVE